MFGTFHFNEKIIFLNSIEFKLISEHDRLRKLLTFVFWLEATQYNDLFLGFQPLGAEEISSDCSAHTSKVFQILILR